MNEKLEQVSDKTKHLSALIKTRRTQNNRLERKYNHCCSAGSETETKVLVELCTERSCRRQQISVVLIKGSLNQVKMLSFNYHSGDAKVKHMLNKFFVDDYRIAEA